LPESSNMKWRSRAAGGGQEMRVLSFRRKGAVAASPHTHRSRDPASRHQFGSYYRYSPW
jgi:hypothetical protein